MEDKKTLGFRADPKHVKMIQEMKISTSFLLDCLLDKLFNMNEVKKIEFLGSSWEEHLLNTLTKEGIIEDYKTQSPKEMLQTMQKIKELFADNYKEAHKILGIRLEG